ncbi:hypothetical protein B0H14DRAFT_3172661 [Mycena olivaceomarginata]|nr:hypothetical protein B0H14DRAFT_3172661 [Mycena olivaceomarginata]
MADSETDSTKECSDCGKLFPLRQASGKCAKCTKLSGHTRDSAEYQDIFSWPQCLLCGITRRNMAPPAPGSIQTCGTATCNLVARGSSVASESGLVVNGLGTLGPSIVANAANEADKARLEATCQRLKLPPVNPNSRNPALGTHLTTGTLLAHEHGGGLPGDTLIMICWEVRSSKNSKLDARLGSASKKWSANLFLNDIKSDIVKAINIEWTQQTLVPLEDTPSNAPIYLHDVPKKWKHFLKTAKNSPFICLELYVHYDAWLLRKEAIENQEMLPSTSQNYSSKIDDVTGRKRGRTESSKNVAAPKNKQIRPLAGGGVLSSEFSRSGRSGRAAVQTQSPITFKKITCITAVQTGNPTLIDTGDIFRGHIFDKPFSSGTMKQAFDLILENGDQYVAKCFYKLSVSDNDLAVSDSEVEVSVETNRIEIEGEIERLAIGKWMLDAFYRHCKSRKDIKVDTNIAFTDAFLAVEVDRPSIASGVHLITENNDGLTWLVERKHSSTVTKFSGTLVHHSHRRDLRSATISAFAHFVFGYSKRTLVVADLQGTPSLVRNNEGFILFDLMTHTVDGLWSRGLWKEGIETFVDDHNCTDLCRSLSLDTHYPLVMQMDGEEDEGEKGELSDSDSDGDGGLLKLRVVGSCTDEAYSKYSVEDNGHGDNRENVPNSVAGAGGGTMGGAKAVATGMAAKTATAEVTAPGQAKDVVRWRRRRRRQQQQQQLQEWQLQNEAGRYLGGNGYHRKGRGVTTMAAATAAVTMVVATAAMATATAAASERGGDVVGQEVPRRNDDGGGDDGDGGGGGGGFQDERGRGGRSRGGRGYRNAPDITAEPRFLI